MISRRIALGLAAGTALARGALAQASFPDQPVRLIVPFAPGGSADIIGRVIARAMGPRLRQSVVVENRSGAGGQIGVEATARARPDGHTVVMAAAGAMLALPGMPPLPYDPLRDLAPVSHILSAPWVLVTAKNRGLATLGDIVAQARREPGKLTFGSAGTSIRLAMELFKQRAGLDIVNVPYRGAAPALTDLMSGQIHMVMGDIGSVLGAVRGGEVLPVGMMSEARSPALPDTPTFVETGLEGVVSESWYVMLAPAGTPADRIAVLNAALVAALDDAEVKRTLTDQGNRLVGSSPEALAAMLRAENAKWIELVRTTGLRLE